MPQIALLTWSKFKREPDLSGVVRITHFVRDDLVVQTEHMAPVNKLKKLFALVDLHFVQWDELWMLL